MELDWYAVEDQQLAFILQLSFQKIIHYFNIFNVGSAEFPRVKKTHQILSKSSW